MTIPKPKMAVIDDERKKRWRKGFKRHKKSATEIGQQADRQIEDLLIRRFDKLTSVRRFVALWLILFVLLIFTGVVQLRALSAYYQTPVPVAGGIYHEGIEGNFTNANPLFAAGKANSAVSKLVFSGLFKYDNSNNLVGDLAEDWQFKSTEDIYSVKLKKNVTWHDGQPFTADDVVFTYSTIQNPESQSSLYSSWEDIKVVKQDDYTVDFDLPNALSSFPHSLTTGILPEHILKEVPPIQLRSSPFNTAPIGTGPFVWKFIEVSDRGTEDQQQRISLDAFDGYWPGKPNLDGFNLIVYTDELHLIQAFKDEQINAVAGLEEVPEDLRSDSDIESYITPLTGMVIAFFNNSEAPLNDKAVRQALIVGVDKNQIPLMFDFPVKLANNPLLPGQLGYNDNIKQPSFNQVAANKMLDEAGWVKNAEGQRMKDGKVLELELSAQENSEGSKMAEFLQDQWGELGVKVTVRFYDSEYLQGAVIANHDYDILLHGISIGVDPDVFAYWESSQASITSQGHLNLSEYRSKVADEALGAARTRADQATRATKYKAFLQTWVADSPALILYRPNILYISRGPVYNFEREAANVSTDRYYNVYEWMIRQQRKTMQ